MQQGKPIGKKKNARGGICPAGRERTFEGVPMYGGRRSKLLLFFDIRKFLFNNVYLSIHFCVTDKTLDILFLILSKMRFYALFLK